MRPPNSSCLSSEEWWWVNARSADAGWVLYADLPMPTNGALWGNAHVVVGDPGLATRAKGSLSIYAGDSSSRKNIIVNADIGYANPSGYDALALVGSDAVLNLSASLLAQNDGWRVGRSCGTAYFPERNYGFDVRLEYLRPPFLPLLEDGWSYDDWRELPTTAWAT